jgi:hypothetical protein
MDPTTWNDFRTKTINIRHSFSVPNSMTRLPLRKDASTISTTRRHHVFITLLVCVDCDIAPDFLPRLDTFFIIVRSRHRTLKSKVRFLAIRSSPTLPFCNRTHHDLYPSVSSGPQLLACQNGELLFHKFIDPSIPLSVSQAKSRSGVPEINFQQQSRGYCAGDVLYSIDLNLDRIVRLVLGAMVYDRIILTWPRGD